MLNADGKLGDRSYQGTVLSLLRTAFAQLIGNSPDHSQLFLSVPRMKLADKPSPAEKETPATPALKARVAALEAVNEQYRAEHLRKLA